MAEEEESTPRKTSDINLDLINRDPNRLNPQIKTNYDDVIGEPEGAHSKDCVWINAYKCFEGGKGCCYNCLTFVCALPLACLWGCTFSCIQFCQIWYITPFYRCFNMLFSCFAKMMSTLIHCCCDPCYESMALMFTQIFIHKVDGATSYRTKRAEELNLARENMGFETV